MRKKLLSLVLALIMCLGLAVPAMAAYEVKSDKCTYELSNDPIGTTECNHSDWDEEKGDYVAAVHTVYIIPDHTVVTCKTAPDGKTVAGMRADGLILNEYLEWGSEFWDGEAFTIPPLLESEQEAIIYRLFAEEPDEYGMPYPIDRGIYIMSATSAAKAGITAGTAPAAPTAPTTPTTPSTGFTDVAANAYYAAPVTWALEKGITTGTSTTTFSPGQSCTNAQILTFLWRAYGQPEPTIGNPYTNSIPDAYVKAAVWAYEKGMVSGTTFDVDKPCTRAMAVTYMWQAAGSPMPFASADSFTDVSADASYALAVAWALEKGITTGTSATTFSPDEICNRGQIVTFLHRNLA